MCEMNVNVTSKLMLHVLDLCVEAPTMTETCTAATSARSLSGKLKLLEDFPKMISEAVLFLVVQGRCTATVDYSLSVAENRGGDIFLVTPVVVGCFDFCLELPPLNPA